MSNLSQIEPPFSAFESYYKSSKPLVIWRKMISDMETPVSAYLKLTNAGINSFLLESVEGGNQLGRYSIIGMAPDLIWKAHGNDAYINAAPDRDQSSFTKQVKPCFDSLRELLEESRIDLPTELSEKLPPMFAGVFGYFGYDTVRLVEDIPHTAKDVLDVPDAVFIRPTILAVFDNVRQEITFITPIKKYNNRNAKNTYNAAAEMLANVMSRLQGTITEVNNGAKDQDINLAPIRFESNTTPDQYKNMVAEAKEYIAAGDIFQVVLSQRFSSDFTAPPFQLYRALRHTNPSPFLFYLNFNGFSLIGSSPEILVRIRDNEITIRPIAGTRKRGKNIEEDNALAQDLLNDPKECAEHLMLMDLGRNDVGRAAAMNSVKVGDKFTIEKYSHVMHIVSNVTGKLHAEKDALDALFSGFPAGTVSGAPKIRAMEIIDELEQHARGPYGGCIGYFSADGNVDSCIALRTAMIKDGMMHVQAGAGIVADSDPQSEQEECENKAGALMAAAKLAYALDHQ